MIIRQPLNHIRRGTVLPHDTDDKAGTDTATRHDQRVTNTRPHYGTRSDGAGLVIIASANDPGTYELAWPDQRSHGLSDLDDWDLRTFGTDWPATPAKTQMHATRPLPAGQKSLYSQAEHIRDWNQ